MFGLVGGAAVLVGKEQLKKEARFLESEVEVLSVRAKEIEGALAGEPVSVSFPHSTAGFNEKPFPLHFKGASDKGFVEVRYDGVLPEGFRFGYESDASEHAREFAIVQSLFGEKGLEKLHFDTEISSSGDGELIFRRRFSMAEETGGFGTLPRLRLKLSHQILDRSSDLIKDFRAREEHSVTRALMTRARGGHPGALEVLIEEFPEEEETKEVISILRDNAVNPNLKESLVVLSILVDKDVGKMVEAATDKHLNEVFRKRACQTLIRRREEAGIVGALKNPPFGLEVELIEALKTPSDAAQDVLFKMLDTSDEEIMLAAAQAFQRMGTRLSVMRLNEFRDKWGLSGEVKKALEIAVERIQDRLGEGGGRGGLSVVDDEEQAGKLSLSNEERGRVALAKKQGVIKGS